MATTRTAQEFEGRRRLAVARIDDGYSQVEVARFFGVKVRSVRRWVAAHRRDDVTDLAVSTAPGR